MSTLELLEDLIREVYSSLTEEKLAACVLVTSRDGRVLAVSRKTDPNDFGLPGGKVDPGEVPIDAAARELEEETGLSIVDIDEEPIYDARDAGGYRTLTYRATVEGEVSTDEPGRVKWVEPRELLAGSFSKYNGEVLRKAGIDA